MSGELAVTGDACKNHETIHADHGGMSKFSTRADPRYKQILYVIEMLLEGHAKDGMTPAIQSMYDVHYSVSQDF
jgi:hypothetical protein